jgi:putative ABC transport system permease protein
MLHLLRSVSLRDYRAAPMRLVLMVGGIAVGVALIAALGIINVSVLSNFRASLERAAGKAALQVVLGTGEVGFDEGAVAAVSKDDGVANAFGLVRGWLATTDDSGDTLQLFGVDLTTDAMDSYDVRAVGEQIDELEFLNDPLSVLLTEEYAERRGVKIGDRVPFASPRGIERLHVRGLLRAEGLATVFGGNLAVMDLPAAQRLLGKEARVDQVDVLLRPATDVASSAASRGRASLLLIGHPACAAWRAVRARDRSVPGDARRVELALPACRRVHRLQHQRDGGHPARA